MKKKKLQISKDAAHAADVTDQNIEMDVSKKNGPLGRKIQKKEKVLFRNLFLKNGFKFLLLKEKIVII